MKNIRLDNLRQIRRFQNKLINDLYFERANDFNRINAMNKSVNNLINIFKLEMLEKSTSTSTSETVIFGSLLPDKPYTKTSHNFIFGEVCKSEECTYDD